MTDIRYFLDEHCDPRIAATLASFSIEASTAVEKGRLSLSDESHVDWALQEGYVIVTRDRDYLRLDSPGRTHAGIAFCPRNDRHSIGDYACMLADLAKAESAETMIGTVRYI